MLTHPQNEQSLFIGDIDATTADVSAWQFRPFLSKRAGILHFSEQACPPAKRNFGEHRLFFWKFNVWRRWNHHQKAIEPTTMPELRLWVEQPQSRPQ
jgi:hypothetical protein